MACFEPNGRKVRKIRIVYYPRMYTVRIAPPSPRWLGLRNLSQPKVRCLECAALQGEISEYLSDVLASYFVTQWADLPESIRKSIKDRLGAKKLKKLCMS